MTTYYTDILNCSPDYILDNNLIRQGFLGFLDKLD